MENNPKSTNPFQKKAVWTTGYCYCLVIEINRPWHSFTTKYRPLYEIQRKRINNFKPYLVAGVSTSLNLSSNEKNNDDNYSNVFRVTSQSFNYEIGFGIDFYLVYFKFSPSIRGIFSIQNELIQDNNPDSPWTSNIKSLLSQGVVINLTFEWLIWNFIHYNCCSTSYI